MSWWHSHPEAATIVKKHWKDAELVVIAHQSPCIKVRDDELANVERVIRPLDATELRRWAPKKKRSWMAAVLVCKADDLRPLAEIAVDLRLDPGRFHFYVHADAPIQTLAPWARAGLSLPHVDVGIKDWRGQHKLLGIDFNAQIVDDFLSEK